METPNSPDDTSWWDDLVTGLGSTRTSSDEQGGGNLSLNKKAFCGLDARCLHLTRLVWTYGVNLELSEDTFLRGFEDRSYIAGQFGIHHILLVSSFNRRATVDGEDACCANFP